VTTVAATTTHESTPGRRPDAPLPSRIGPYRILETISRGGGAVVYRARDESGRDVAVKALASLQPANQECLRREIYTLARLRHPGVVALLASGLGDDPPWYAMELLDRLTLEALWAERATIDAPAVAATICGVCDTLAFLHGEGIVHRDVKPSNIAVRDGGDPVLVDFGFVARFAGPVGRESLEAGGFVWGTIQYMAPEQYRGEYVDARSDLFSLGCILYEGLTGERPFRPEDRDPWDGSIPTVAQPSRANAGVPAAVDDLVLALLANDPGERPGYADDIARVLRTCFAVAPPREGPTGRPYLYRARFSGREELLATMERALDAAASGGGHVMLVAGESGVGKTRFAMEVTALAAARPFEVTIGECLPVHSGVAGSELRGAPLHPFAPLLCAIADRCRHEGPEATWALLGGRARVLVPYEPALVAVPGFAAEPDIEALDGEAARARVISALIETLRAFARVTPLMIVIDDVQWADNLTLALLSSLAGSALRDVPVLVVATYRTDEAPPEIAALAATSGVTALDIQRLDGAGIATMVSGMLAMPVPPAPLVEVVARESEGNPFFVGEYLRGAVATAHLRRAGGRWMLSSLEWASLALELPRTLRALITDRLDRLPPHARPAVEAAAVLGRHVDAELVAALAGLDGDDRLHVLSLLVRRQICEEARDGSLRFTHDKLREVAYAVIPDERRPRLHERAARLIEERYAGRPDFPSFYGALAGHWSLAGNAERATVFFDLAAEHALAAGAYGEAHAALRAALELDRAPATPPAIHRAGRFRMLSVASFGLGHLDESIRHGESGLAALGVGGVPPAPGAFRDIAAAVAKRIAFLATPRPLRRADETASERALIWNQLANLFFFAGDSLRTFAANLWAFEAAERSGMPRPRIEACASLGFVLGTARLRRAARRYFSRASRIAAESGDTRGRAHVLYLDAMHCIGLARWEETRVLAAQAAELFDGIGDAHEAEIARTICAHGHYYAGDIAGADEQMARVEATARRRANPQHVAWAQFGRARSLIACGEPAAALALCRSARGLIADLPDTLSNVMLEGTLARAALYAGETEAALEACRRLIARIAGGEWPATGQCIDGLGAVADVLSALSEAGTGVIPVLDIETAQAVDALRRFARIFPIGQPVLHRVRARLLVRARHVRRAERAWRRSVTAARLLGMPIDEALAQLERAALHPDARTVGDQGACMRLAALGCAPLADLVTAPRSSPPLLPQPERPDQVFDL